MKRAIRLLAAGSVLIASLAQADTQTRTTAWDYTGNAVQNVTVEPDVANDCLQTTYTYDTNGNRNGSTTNACNGATGYTLWS